MPLPDEHPSDLCLDTSITHTHLLVHRWKFYAAGAFLGLLFVVTVLGLIVGILWLVYLSFNIESGNQEDHRFRQEITKRIEEIEKSTKKVEETVVP